MLALGSVKSIITDSVKSGRIPFDMHGFLTGVVLADLNLSGVSQHSRILGVSALLFTYVNLGVGFFLQPGAGAPLTLHCPGTLTQVSAALSLGQPHGSFFLALPFSRICPRAHAHCPGWCLVSEEDSREAALQVVNAEPLCPRAACVRLILSACLPSVFSNYLSFLRLF